MNQRAAAKFIYDLTIIRSGGMIRKEYGNKWWKDFRHYSDKQFRRLISEFPDIGDSMFAFNYCYAPGYAAWYKAMEKMGLNAHERDVLMLKMNEKMLLTVPKPLLHAIGKAYYRNMEKGAERRMANKPRKLPPFDWDMEYSKIDRDSFRINIRSCGFIAYAKKYGCTGMLPGICQVDYMISHYMNVGFERTQTLGAGGSCCDGCYRINGSCEFDIEKRLAERK